MGTITRDEVIAIEQKAVDRAYHCYTERLKELSGKSVASASASNKDAFANRVKAEDQAAAYGGLGGEALVISRVDAPDTSGREAATWYVGRRPVWDVHTHDLVVVEWTNPLAKKWLDALPEAPGDVSLRRKLSCARDVVKDYFDEIAVPAVLPPADAAGRQAASPAVQRQPQARPPVPAPDRVARVQRRKPQPLDAFLLRELQRSRRGSMRDIVETIRRDQMALVSGAPSDILVVQGGPGTGKSAVGLHRVTWLVNNKHFSAQDILVIGPHQRFLDYVSQVLPTLGTRNVNSVQLSRLWDGDVRGTDTPQARLVKSDDRMAAVLRRRVERECRPQAIGDFTTTASYKDAEPEVTVTAGRTTLRLPHLEVLELLAEVREADGSHRERRDRFRTLLVDRLLRELVALAPRNSRDDAMRRDLSRQVERMVERVWPSLSAREALRTLYHSPDLLRTCAEGVLDDEEQAALHRPRAKRVEEEPWTLDDQVCLEELNHLIAGEIPQRYGHVVIDEAQDLTPMQARSLRRRLAVNGSMTVLGDLAQATGPHVYGDWDRLGTLLSDHGDWRVAELNTSYRVPAEIMEFVAPLARTIAPTLPRPQAVRATGEEAVRTVLTEPWKLLDDTVAQAGRLIGTSDGHTLRSVAVIVPDDSGWLDEIRRQLDQADGITEQGREAVSVLAAAQAKGMEYDHVLVVEPATIADRGPGGLSQLYVALTRSTQTLTVLHTSPLPEALTNAGDETGVSRTAGDARVTAALPEIGTDVRVQVIGQGLGGRYPVKALSPVIDFPMFLTVRHGAIAPRFGEKLDCWIFTQEANHCLVTSDQRGRQPISPSMAERYVAALGVFEELLSSEGTVPREARHSLSELKGMANRILRRDQADWVEVRRVLGNPDRHRLGLLRDLAAGTARALKDNTLDTGRLREDLIRSGWLPALAEARETLQGRMVAGTEPAAEISAIALQQSNAKDSESVPTKTSDSARSKAEPSKTLLQALENSAAADRTCNTHEAVRLELMAALLRANLQPTSSPIVDVSCTMASGAYLYEVLGAGRSSYADLREGASRILEINHTLAKSASRLYLVLSEQPAQDWSAETIRDIFRVHVLWRTPEGWGGEDTASALGAQTDAIV